MAHRVRVRLGLGLGFVDIRVSVRVSVVYAKVYNVSWPYLAVHSARHDIVIEYRLGVMCRRPYVGKCAVTYSARPRLTAKRVERVVSISWASCLFLSLLYLIILCCTCCVINKIIMQISTNNSTASHQVAQTWNFEVKKLLTIKKYLHSAMSKYSLKRPIVLNTTNYWANDENNYATDFIAVFHKLQPPHSCTTCLSLLSWLTEVRIGLSPSPPSSSSFSSSVSLASAAAIFSVNDRLISRLLLATAVRDDASQTSISHAFFAASASRPARQ